MIFTYGKISELNPQMLRKLVNNVVFLGAKYYIPFAGVLSCKVIGYLLVYFY